MRKEQAAKTVPVFQALASEHRINILIALKGVESNYRQIARTIGLSPQLTRQHIHVLIKANLVIITPCGRSIRVKRNESLPVETLISSALKYVGG